VRAAPAVSCANCTKQNAHEHTGPTEASLANESANLTPASGRRDRTTSPYASVPFVVGTSASTASHRAFRDDREPPLLSGETGGFNPVICLAAKAEYFCFLGLTRFLQIRSDLPVGSTDRAFSRHIVVASEEKQSLTTQFSLDGTAAELLNQTPARRMDIRHFAPFLGRKFSIRPAAVRVRGERHHAVDDFNPNRGRSKGRRSYVRQANNVRLWGNSGSRISGPSGLILTHKRDIPLCNCLSGSRLQAECIYPAIQFQVRPSGPTRGKH
jgi:hypothetical protein